MRIYTITCHNVYNYGATLQAYALQQYLLKLGHNVSIINYMPDYLNWHYRLSWWIPKSSKYYPRLSQSIVLHGLYVLTRFFLDMRFLPRALAFKVFNRKYLRLTSKCRTIEDVTKIVSDADCLITGSDQVWNSKTLPNGLDPAYYLSFAPKRAKTFSYAASFGGGGIDESASFFIKEQLSNLNYISVREQSGISILRSLGIKGTVVCDPVFLLNKEEWQSELGVLSKPNDSYIFVYSLGHVNEKILHDAYMLKNQSGYKIVSLLTNVSIDADKVIRAKGPDCFISLISNAKIILTNSFHASSFSILFNKKFYVYTRNEEKTNARINDLVELYGIEARLNPDTVSFADEIDYAGINKIMSEQIEYSQKWLSKIVCNNE